MGIDEGIQQDGVWWPKASEESATQQIPSFVKAGALESHGGSMFRKR